MYRISATVVAVSATLLGASLVQAQAKPSLRLIRVDTFPGYTGDFDHFALDRERGRSLLSAEDHGTLEVFSLSTGEHLRTVKERIETPHSILVSPGSSALF